MGLRLCPQDDRTQCFALSTKNDLHVLLSFLPSIPLCMRKVSPLFEKKTPLTVLGIFTSQLCYNNKPQHLSNLQLQRRTSQWLYVSLVGQLWLALAYSSTSQVFSSRMQAEQADPGGTHHLCDEREEQES